MALSTTRNLEYARAVGVGLIIISSPWSVSIEGLKVLEERQASCRSGQYRFRAVRVYRRAVLSVRSELAAKAGGVGCDRPAAQSRTPSDMNRGTACAAQYQPSPRLAMPAIAAQTRAGSPVFHATLVLEIQAAGFLDRRRQFCSDRDNEISASLAAPFSACLAAKKKTTTRFPSLPRWLTRERSPCHGRSFLVDNSLLLPH